MGSDDPISDHPISRSPDLSMNSGIRMLMRAAWNSLTPS